MCKVLPITHSAEILTIDYSYMFDEPSSYLDVKQRLAAARMIRSLSKHDNYIIGKSPLLKGQKSAVDISTVAC